MFSLTVSVLIDQFRVYAQPAAYSYLTLTKSNVGTFVTLD